MSVANVDISVERDSAVDTLFHAVCTEKTERDWEQQEITHQHTKDEQKIYGEDGLFGIFALIVV